GVRGGRWVGGGGRRVVRPRGAGAAPRGRGVHHARGRALHRSAGRRVARAAGMPPMVAAFVRFTIVSVHLPPFPSVMAGARRGQRAPPSPRPRASARRGAGGPAGRAPSAGPRGERGSRSG